MSRSSLDADARFSKEVRDGHRYREVLQLAKGLRLLPSGVSKAQFPVLFARDVGRDLVRFENRRDLRRFFQGGGFPRATAMRQSRLAIHNRQRPRQAEETVPSVRVTRATRMWGREERVSLLPHAERGGPSLICSANWAPAVTPPSPPAGAPFPSDHRQQPLADA